MKVHLLGTGSADGLPNPFCRCETCEEARSTGRTRASSCALVDDTILIDPGPSAGPASARWGADLREVSHVLITHGHHDHLAPEFLLWRSWIDGLGPLVIHGPAQALERCRHWVHDAAPVHFEVVQPGDVRMLATRQGDYRVHVVAAAHGHGNGDPFAEEAVLYDITAPDGRRLLYATDTGPLTDGAVEAVRGGAFDLLLIEETFGPHAGAGHLNFTGLAQTLAALRAAGAVIERTDVIAFHLSHHNPVLAELESALAAIGARAVDDGAVLEAGLISRERDLIIGGARSGKSHHAESLAAREPAVLYVATGGAYPDDAEWTARVRAHRARRPAHWHTIETTDLVGVLHDADDSQTILIDCIGMWLTAALDEAGAWPEPSDAVLGHVRARIDALAAAVASCPARLLIVTNEVGQGVVPETASGRVFRDLLGIANTRLAAACSRTTFLIAGRALATTELP